jgi:hypothetical protein
MSVGEVEKIFLQVDNMLTEVLTVELAAYHYNFAKTTIRQWCDEDKVKFYKVYGMLLIDKNDIERFINRDHK